MQIQPTYELLGIWRGLVDLAYYRHHWQWGGHDGANSISDAEQLLCLLHPATQVDGMALDNPDETAEGVLGAVRGLGDAIEVPQRLTAIIREYFERYCDGDGQPEFGGGGYIAPVRDGESPTAEQQSLHLVSSYATSVSLCLAVLGFVRVFRQQVTRSDLQADLDTVAGLASLRLSAAMVGLLRSFVVRIFEADEPAGQALCRITNQAGLAQRHLVGRLRLELQDTRATLREFKIGSGLDRVLDETPGSTQLFACGWTWGVVAEAPTVATSDRVELQPDGVATNEPSLAFTVEAMRAVDELASERTRLLGLLNDDQQRLAQELRRRGDVTRAYWSTLATFGDGTWPLEDVPWHTADGEASDFLSVMVAWLTIGGGGAPATPTGWARFGAVLSELAMRGRVNRRAMPGDAALAYHHPGVRVHLDGAEKLDGPEVCCLFNDYAPLLLECAARVAGEPQTTEQRQRHLDLADAVWVHLNARRLERGRLWDRPDGAFAGLGSPVVEPSWFYTARVMRALVVAAGHLAAPPPPSERLTEHVADLLAEAERMFDQETLRTATHAPMAAADRGREPMRQALDDTRGLLRRARRIMSDRPGTATALVMEAMRRLDELARARGGPDAD